MKNKTPFRAVCAVCVSFASLWSVQTLVLRLFPTLFPLVPYLAGWLAAVLVFAVSLRLLPCTREAEGELVQGEAESGDHLKAKLRLFRILLATGLLLSVNFTLYFLKGPLRETRPGAELFFAALIGILLKPFCEEFLFRYLYLGTLVNRGELKPAGAVILQGFLFALWHPRGSMLFAFFAGLVLGLVAHQSRNGGADGYRRGYLDALAVHVLYNMTLYTVEALM